MSIRKILGVTSLVCMMPLAACEEESDDPVEPDADAPVFVPDSGTSVPGSGDGAIVFPQTDASQGSDAGSANPEPTADAATPAPNADAGSGPSDPMAALGARFFLPTPEPTNTAAPKIELDRQGNVHSVYPAYVAGGAYYSFCPAQGCNSKSDAKEVEFETDGTVSTAMLALTADGRPRVLLSTMLRLYWAECDQGCTERSNWRLVELMNHGGELAATGEALALDPNGRPRFLLHGYRNPYDFFGPKKKETQLASCDANCASPASWSYNVIAPTEIWEGSHLRYDASGRGHVATTVFNYEDTTQKPLTAYLTCQGSCNGQEQWKGIGFAEPVTSLTDAVSIYPTVSLALTKAGNPRVAMLITNDEGKRSIGYAECDANCGQTGSWRGINLWAVDSPIGAGLDLALDSKDMPVFAHTINFNVLLTYCEEQPCTGNGAKWESTNVERGDQLPPDDIFLEWNCTISAWFLHSPSLALTANDQPRVGYQSREVSGGFSRPDPLKPRCAAGTDMTFSRFAAMPSYIQK